LSVVAPLLLKDFAIDLVAYRNGIQITGLVSIIGLFFWPWLADKFGRRNILALNIAVFSLARWREHEWTAPRGRNDIRAIAMLLAFGFALALYVRERGWHLTFDPRQTPLDRGEGGAAPPGFDAGPDPGYQFQFAWLPVVAALVLAALAVAALVLANRRANPSSANAELAAELALTLDLSLDDLRAETDPRRAVIAAYARLERVLAAHGEPRQDADTPDEHLARVLGHLDVDRRAVRRLVDLFVQAKFSQHDVDAPMKDEAIGALEQVRDELRAAAAKTDVDPPGVLA